MKSRLLRSGGPRRGGVRPGGRGGKREAVSVEVEGAALASPPDQESQPPIPDAPISSPGPILVEVLTDVVGWAAENRFDVLLRGHIVSAAPAESLTIRDAQGAEVASVEFGQQDELDTVALADGETGYRAGFQLYLPMQGGEEPRFADLWVRAAARDGAVFQEAMRVGCMADRAAILAGPAREMPVADLPAPSGMVYLESATLNAAGQLRVRGWTLSRSQIVAVRIFLHGEAAGNALHGRERADVAAAYPNFSNSNQAGFVLERHMPGVTADAASVTVQVLCLSGACHAVTIPLIREAGPLVSGQGLDVFRLILLVCDQSSLVSPDVLRVLGWTWCGHGIQRVAIEVDGRFEGDADHGLDRPDVANEHSNIPSNIGFSFEKTIPGLSEGRHVVRVIAISGAGDEKDLTVPVVDPENESFRFELDKPETRDGAAIHPISGRLMIEGWALARGGMDTIDVSLDGTVLGQAHYGMARTDVGLAFPGWENAARSGYNFHCPPRALPDGEHVIELTARSGTGETFVHGFRVTIRKPDNPEETVSIRRRIKRVERNTVDGVLKQLNWRPSFHLFVVSHAEADDAAQELTIKSIIEQCWTDVRVTIVARDAGEALAIRALTGRLAHEAANCFEVVEPASAAWTAPLTATAQAALIGVLSSGDELGRDALAAFALATGLHPEAECLYADEFRLPPGGTRPDGFFKPDFSPALLLSTNYIGRPLVARRDLSAVPETTPEVLMRDGFYDLVLRWTEAAAAVHHIAELLSRTDKGQAPDNEPGAAAVARAAARRGLNVKVTAGEVPGAWRSQPMTPAKGKVSIIIPTRAAKGLIEICLKTLRGVTAYKNFEIICIDNIPGKDESWKTFVADNADKVVALPPPFNWSRFNNHAAAAADGEYLLFLNDDIEIVEPGWLDALLDELSWPGVGIAGARLLYPNRTVQHAGMFLGHGMGRHAFRHAEATDPGYFGLALTRREVIAVTGACLLVRRDMFERLGRFDEAHDVINNDMDFCLRAHRAGQRVIYTPHATLIHHELASRADLPEDFDSGRFHGEWRGLFAAGDPYFNPRLSRHTDDYQIDDEGVRVMYAGHPLIEPDSVKAILVVKLDHIGDFMTSLPAIRRLKASFPSAKLTALVAPASAVLAAIEPAIDECIPFEFFHARSELGEKELTPDDLAGLTARLAPYRFDIAVDLRKHLSTRHILLCAGARLLAGFDQLESFPWLDVTLEWDGDKALQRKRGHVTDDLLNMVTAIGVACETGRDLFGARPEPMPVADMPDHVRPLFARPVVAIHPGSGNVMRQLPEKHIPTLIDLLVERNDVTVLLVGGKDDEEKAAALAARAARPDRVASTAGQIPLKDLPALFAACRLFIGGNSGPKHIAAASGVPTIGIHSGVVDPGEWGPVGERAVALYRDMTCAPCFLSKPEDCPRGLACVELMEPALVHRIAEMFLAAPMRPKPAAAMPEPPKAPRVKGKR